jgi:demethylmenaquinone methyltransferase/2-methoxy-6-polyprenyl-1,4-benzoquinol methylase
MTQDQNNASFEAREHTREQLFQKVWDQDLDDVFADVASYYDRANQVASFGLWTWMQSSFVDTIQLQPQQKILDVCAGTNAIGIALLQREPSLDVYALDRSLPMQVTGRQTALKEGINIENVNGDAHHLPFADNQFDVVTLQYASRHLRVMDAFAEIKRVLKPGGHFYHSDMLRPDNSLLEFLYRNYLRLSLNVTAFVFGSGQTAQGCKDYFVRTLHMFYTADELSQLLRDLGYQNITNQTLMGGMVGSHHAINGD